mmetsp:Transcript_41416/g.99205  ORF Transcript_41416/g.99205 Transcript_41416/m.99205 type:complete len:703 (-) Transcript_41416:120-2228(-)
MPPCQVEQPQRHSSELSSTAAMMNPLSQKKTSSSKTSKASSATAAASAATTNDSYLNTNVGVGRRSSNATANINTNSVGNNQSTMNFPGNFDPHHLGNDNSPMKMMCDADATAVAAGSSGGGGANADANAEQSSLFYRQLKQHQQQQQQQMMMMNNRNSNMVMMSSMAGVATDRRGSGSTSAMGMMSMLGSNDLNSHNQNNEASAMGGAGAFGGMMNQGSMSNNLSSNHMMGFGMSTAGMGAFQPNNNSSNAMSNSNAMMRMNFQSMNSGDGFNSQNFTMNRKPSFRQGNSTPEQEEEMLKMQLQMLQARRAAQQQQQQQQKQYIQGQQGHEQRDMEELRRLRQAGNASNESAGGIFVMNHNAADPLEQQGMMRNAVNTNMQFNSGVGMGSMMNRMGGGLGSMNMPMPFHHNRPIADDYLMLTQRHDALTNTMMGMSSSSNPTSQDRIELSSSRYQRGDNTMGSGFTGFDMGPGLELGEEMKGTSSAWDKFDDKTRSSGASGVVASSKDSKKKKRKKQKKKPADMPRRPLSAYNLFFSEERERILKELDDPDKAEKTFTEKTEEETAADKADESSEAEGKTTKKPQALLRPLLQSEMKRRPHRKTHGKISFRALAAMVGKRWKSLPGERKQYYQNLAKVDMVRQKAAMEAYYEKEAEKLVAETEKNDERKGNLKEEDDSPSSKKKQRSSASEAESKKAELIV